MSYVLHIWPEPLPATYDEAVMLPSRLSRLPGPGHPLLLALAQCLTARYPDLGPDGDDEDAVWTDGPLAANARAGLMTVGVRTPSIDTVVPFIVSTARSLGLGVLDEQVGAWHGPAGRLPGPASVRASGNSTHGVPLARTTVQAVMRATLGPVVLEAGFAPGTGDADFTLTQPAARFDVQIAVEPRGIGQSVSVVLTVRLPGTEQDPLVQHVMPEGAEFHFHAHRIAEAAGLAWPQSSGSIGAETHVETPDDVDDLGARWNRLFRAELLPRVRRCASVDGLARELTTQLDAFTPQRIALLLAASAGRKDLQAVHDALLRVQPAPWHEQTTELLGWLLAPRRGALGDASSGATLADALPMLLGGGPPLRADETGRLLPLDHQPVTRRFLGGLAVACVVEAEGRHAPLLHSQLTAWAASAQSAFDIALRNLHARADQALRQTHAEGFTLLQLDGHLDASLMLLDAVWDSQLARQTPAGALVAVPKPGLLAFSDIAAPGALAALRAFVAREAADEACALSTDLFYRREGKWERLPARRAP